MLPVLCYALIVAVWLLDLATPQLFVAAILLNVPIALSSLALRRRFTIGLVVAAEFANIIAAYENAARDGGRFDSIAIGDRILLAASFLLVGYLAIKTQGLGRSAGLSDARAEQAQRERQLRLAMERVRESLNPELVRRATLREALGLMHADRGMLVPDIANDGDWYWAESSATHVQNRRDSLSAEIRSLLAKRIDSAKPLDSKDIVAAFALETLGSDHGIIAGAVNTENQSRLLLLRGERAWSEDEARFLQAYFERCSNALSQALLFVQNIEQSIELAKQNRDSLERGSLVRDLVYALAHDLRTPLAAADVTMRQAHRGAYGALPEAYRTVLSASIESNNESQRMVDTLLTIARYEAGDVQRPSEQIDLLQIAIAVQNELTAMAQERGVRISVLGDTATLQGDSHELRRAATNLLANAIAASSGESEVSVNIESARSEVRLVVSDRGYGVPPEERDGLFQRFGVGERRRGSGTGLGLYVVRLIVERHGGSVRYEPNVEGGSRFSLLFPRVNEA